MLRRWCLFVSMCGLILVSLQHCSTPAATSEGTSSEGTSSEAVTDASSPTESSDGTFACGPKSCKQGMEMCLPRGQGACIGDAPDANGKCKPYCQLMQCGRSEGTCLCTSYSCSALPTGCTDCACIKKQTEYSFCDCTEKDGGIIVGCPSP